MADNYVAISSGSSSESSEDLGQEFPGIHEHIRELGRDFRTGSASFDEGGSFLHAERTAPAGGRAHAERIEPLQAFTAEDFANLHPAGFLAPDSGRAASGKSASTSAAKAGTARRRTRSATAENAEADTDAPSEPADPDIIPPPPTNIGPMPYRRYYAGTGSNVGMTRAFYKDFGIPRNVRVERFSGSRLEWGEDFIIVPLYAITEGGLRFPVHAFIRWFLEHWELAPCQLSINVFRILSCIIKMVEKHNVRFTLSELVLMYTVGRTSHNRVHFCTRQGFDHLFERLADSDKWANEFVKVSGDFEWGPLDPRLDSPYRRAVPDETRVYPIPKVRGFPDLGIKTRVLLPGARIAGNFIPFLQFTDRDAPTLLGYTPSYLGFAKKKLNKKFPEKMPRIFQDLAADANELLLGAMQTTSLTLEELAAGVPLPEAEPQAAEEAVDPSVTRRRKRRAPDSRSAVEAAAGDSAKKARAAPSGDVELVAEGSEREVSEHPKFEPEYNFRDARILTTADSVARDPEIAWTLLEGIALPEDMESLPNTRMGNAVVACSSFVRV